MWVIVRSNTEDGLINGCGRLKKDESLKRVEDDYENEPLSVMKIKWSSDVSCKECDSGIEKEVVLKEHCEDVNKKSYQCVYCAEIHPDVPSIANHLSEKHSDRTLRCSDCDFQTNELTLFQHHLINLCCRLSHKHVNASNGTDKDCKIKMKTKKGIEHKKSHPCDLCESSFTLKNQLMKHKNQEHGIDIRCDVCAQNFSSMVSLRSHKFTKHTGKDKICEICGYSTKKTYDFKRHQVKHSNVYAIKCTVCNKGFYSQYDFNEHKNVHTAERPYQCEVCGVDYSRRSSLILHRNRKHPETYDLSKRCQICNQVCLTKETMAAHVKTHVEGRKKYYCDICGKGLLTTVILKIHRRSHTGEKPFDCSYCGRAFSCKKNLSVHIRLHTGDRPYSCKFCWKAYTKSSALKAHEKSHSGHHQEAIPI